MNRHKSEKHEIFYNNGLKARIGDIISGYPIPSSAPPQNSFISGVITGINSADADYQLEFLYDIQATVVGEAKDNIAEIKTYGKIYKIKLGENHNFIITLINGRSYPLNSMHEIMSFYPEDCTFSSSTATFISSASGILSASPLHITSDVPLDYFNPDCGPYTKK